MDNLEPLYKTVATLTDNAKEWKPPYLEPIDEEIKINRLGKKLYAFIQNNYDERYPYNDFFNEERALKLFHTLLDTHNRNKGLEIHLRLVLVIANMDLCYKNVSVNWKRFAKFIKDANLESGQLNKQSNKLVKAYLANETRLFLVYLGNQRGIRNI